jgi:DNA processing protein
MIPGIGNINGKNLIAYCGGAEAVFREKKRALLRIPGIGSQTVQAIVHHRVFDRVLEELVFLEKYQIEPLYFLDENYPFRLKQCVDGPVMLYYKGNAKLNSPRILAMVGTRSATEYGRILCRKVTDGLKDLNVLIVSGLAYGIDTWSHKSALESNLTTVGVLGHSLDRIYPYSNRSLAEKMIHQGGLLSEFVSGTKPDRENFPMRNRIIAGISDAVLVVEAGERGGALITAEIANSYDREVLAFPGRVGDQHSEGCNNLIRKNKAALVQSVTDIIQQMNWDLPNLKITPFQPRLFDSFSEDEMAIIELLLKEGELDIDTLLTRTFISPTKAPAILLNLEFKDILRCLPGKIYKLL